MQQFGLSQIKKQRFDSFVGVLYQTLQYGMSQIKKQRIFDSFVGGFHTRYLKILGMGQIKKQRIFDSFVGFFCAILQENGMSQIKKQRIQIHLLGGFHIRYAKVLAFFKAKINFEYISQNKKDFDSFFFGRKSVFKEVNDCRPRTLVQLLGEVWIHKNS